HERHWKSRSQRSDVNDQTFSTRLHVAKRELHQLDLAEHENLELARNRFRGKKLSGPEVTCPGVVNQNIEITSFGERGIKCFLDGKPISQVETHRMPARRFWDAFHVARCSPNLVTLRHEQFGNGQTDA